MNFVVLAHSFPPENGPECFCSGRFASALAAAGHAVHVVTLERKTPRVSREVYDVLVDPRIKVTTFADRGVEKPFWSRLRFFTHEPSSANFVNGINALKSVLSQYENPILVSRANPIASHIIAWHCRKLAHKWIAHFSDPIPFLGTSTLSFRVKSWMSRFWVRRTLRAADGVSLTNENVNRFYTDTYGRDFTNKPVVVAAHVGEPALTGSSVFSRKTNAAMIVHCGTLTGSRGARQIVEAVASLNENGVPAEFYEVGDLDPALKDFFAGARYVQVLPNLAPDYGIAVSAQADVVFIPDLETSLPYAPFLPSKFVYQLFYDKPIVVFTRNGSTMEKLVRRYPQAGVFFADCKQPQALKDALLQAIQFDRSKMEREAIRSLFTRQTVGGTFARFVSEI